MTQMASSENARDRSNARNMAPPALGHNSTTLRPSRRTRVALLMPLCAVALFFVAREAVSAFYGLRVRQELTALKAEGGAATLAALMHKPPAGTPADPAHALTADELTFPLPQQVSDRWPNVGLQSDLLAPEQKLAKAYLQLTTWNWRHGNWRICSPSELPPGACPSGWNDEWAPFLRKYVESRSAALKQIRRAATSDNAYFPHNWSGEDPRDLPGYPILNRITNYWGNEVAGNLPEYGVLDRAANLLMVDALLHARDGNAAEAFEDVRLMLRLRKLVDGYPLVLARSTAAGLDRTACATLRSVLSFVRPSRELVNRIIGELANREEANALDRALFGETARGLMVYATVPDAATLLAKAGTGQVPQTYFPNRLCARLLWIRTLDEYRFLRSMRAIRAAYRKPLTQAEIILLPTGMSVSRSAPPPIHAYWTSPLADRMTAEIQYAPELVAFAGAHAALARTALVLSLYKANTGAYPVTLGALVPAYLPKAPIDPCDGAPLRYSVRDSGFLVYSVGLDGVDDGGKIGPDITWEDDE